MYNKNLFIYLIIFIGICLLIYLHYSNNNLEKFDEVITGGTVTYLTGGTVNSTNTEVATITDPPITITYKVLTDNIKNVIAWYNPDDCTTKSWKDKFNNVNLTITGGTISMDKFKKLNMVKFNSNTSFMKSDNTVRIQGFTCLVCPESNGSDLSMLFTVNGPNNDSSFRRTVSSGTTDINDIHNSLYINGVTSATSIYNNLGKNTIISVIFKTVYETPICIGATFYSRGYVGTIGDFICFGQNFTQNDIQAAEGYISWKWGLNVLPDTHPYRSMNITINKLLSLPTGLSNVVAWYDSTQCNCLSWNDKINNNHLKLINGSMSKITYPNNNNLSLVSLNTNTTYFISNDTITMKAFVCLIYPIYNEAVGNNSMLFTVNGPNNDSSFRKPLQYADHNGNDVNDPAQIYINGNKTTVYNNTSKYTIISIVFISTQTTKVCLGSTFLNRGYTGYIGDFICLGSGFTSKDIQLAEGFIAWKWGLNSNLPSNHPFYNTNPTNLI